MVRNGHLKQFVDESKGKRQEEQLQKLREPIGIIKVIHSRAGILELRAETRTVAHLQEVFQLNGEAQLVPKRLKKDMIEEITYTDYDLEGVQLPHSDAEVVTLRIGDFNVKRILIDLGSSAEIMY